MEQIELTLTNALNNGRTTIKELSPVFHDSAGKRLVVVSADDLDEVMETIEWLKRTAD
jgi:nitrate reductase NapAB chaperone NapD